jgi:hypothetical protein
LTDALLITSQGFEDPADVGRAYVVGRGVSPERLVAKGYATNPDEVNPSPRHCELVRTDGL